MYQRKKINNVKVVPIKLNEPKPEKILGYDLIPRLHCNIGAIGRKGSGKTNVVNCLLENCTDDETNVIIFSATVNSDPAWIEIRKWLDKREQPYAFFTSIHNEEEDEDRKGKKIKINNLDTLVRKIKEDDKKEAEEKLNKKKGVSKNILCSENFFDNYVVEEIKEKKKKKVAPKYFIVFDDISNELRAKADVTCFMKVVRHYKAKVVVSSQFPTDLDPGARQQVDFWCLFKDFPEDRMEKIFDDLTIPKMKFENFYYLYLKETEEPHSFLYIDRIHNKMRHNFDEEILLPTS